MYKLLAFVTIFAFCGLLEATAREKGGHCSTKVKRDLCQCAPNGTDNCQDACSSDNDCPGLRKCCYHNCNRVCRLPNVTPPRDRCPSDEDYLLCGPTNQVTCEQPVPDRQVCTAGCYCPPGYVRSENGKCIKRLECLVNLVSEPVCTRRHETRQNKCPGCERTCTNPKAEGCHAPCVDGCYCVDGYVRNGHGHCIPVTNCKPPQTVVNLPKPICPPNHVFESCRRTCEPSCANPSSLGCLRRCQTGCFCRPSLVRDYNGNCIPVSQCPIFVSPKPVCEDENMEYKVCHTSCIATCDNPTGTKCNKDCVTGCFCINNYVFHNERCIRPDECPPQTPYTPGPLVCENVLEELKECGCQRTCEDPIGAKCDSSPCVKGCYCRDNYVADPYGNCISPEFCPDPPCGVHEVMAECTSDCQDTCNGKTPCVPRQSCVSGCVCEPGYVINSNSSTCVPRNRCFGRPSCPANEVESSSCSQNCQTDCLDGYEGSSCPTECRNNCCRKRH